MTEVLYEPIMTTTAFVKATLFVAYHEIIKRERYCTVIKKMLYKVILAFGTKLPKIHLVNKVARRLPI